MRTLPAIPVCAAITVCLPTTTLCATCTRLSIFAPSWIQEGAKIDNLVQVAHNVVVGKHTVIAAQTGIAGSVRIGQRTLIGAQVGIIGHIEIGDDTAIGAQSGISKNISGGAWWATPAVPLAEAKQQMAWVRRLGKLFARVKEVEKKLGLS